MHRATTLRGLDPGYLMYNGVTPEKKAIESGLHSYSGSKETTGIRGDTSSPEGPKRDPTKNLTTGQ